MPGFLGGSSGGGGGTGGEIRFPKEFIDPVTKLRVSQPETLIDTDFEYGLQPTKWETLELINNTPSFFSKSGDTTIPGIVSITTNAGTREITVTTALDHGLAVGIPINVTGTKSVTADGAYIINSIPNPTTFTYLCKDNQAETLSIEDLYSSIITGEFFQGSQLRIADAEGITTNGDPVSTLTVTTESAHGFGVNTPFYFLNLNSTVAQEFEAANTAAKSFDSSNSATAQTFDGSNTLSQLPIDFSNSATIGGTVSNITSVSAANDTITVTHTTESFVGQPLGTPLYYDVSTSAGYFSTNPRGVVFLKTTDQLTSSSSTFQVSEVPDGSVIDIEAAITGTFQLANQARTFAGNNINPLTQINIELLEGQEFSFEAANDGGLTTEGESTFFAGGNPDSTVTSFSGSLINVSVPDGAGLGYYTGAMVRYSTTGSAASGLTNNTTYFVDSFFSTGADTFAFTIKPLPNAETAISISGGTGTQTFKRIGVSTDKNIVHVRDSNFSKGEMLKYSFPEDGQFSTSDPNDEKQYYFVDTVYDAHNYILSSQAFSPLSATGGTVTQVTQQGRTFNVHAFTSVGSSTFTVVSGESSEVEVLIVGGGGGGGGRHGGGGGGGGFISQTITIDTAGNYPIVVGGGGEGRTFDNRGLNGGNSSAFGLTAIGGGGGGSWDAERAGSAGGSGGGASFVNVTGSAGTTGQGNKGGDAHNAGTGDGAGGGGAGGAGENALGGIGGKGGDGLPSSILGTRYFFAAGGGGGAWEPSNRAGNGGAGGGGGGGKAFSGTVGIGGALALNNGGNGTAGRPNAKGGAGGANTGSGGGGGGATSPNAGYTTTTFGGGNGGSGIVVVRYPLTPPVELVAAAATGGLVTDVTIGQFVYRIHAFTTVGNSTFSVQNVGSFNEFDYLIVGGGGGGGGWGGGGGAGGLRTGTISLTAGTSYPILVGNGGARGTSVYTGGTNGGNSSAFGITSNGGGGGGWYNGNPGRNGASGGGGGLSEGSGGFPAPGFGNSPATTPSQGNAGGSGGNNSSGAWNTNRGGGGGGAGGPGFPGTGTSANSGRGGQGRDLSAIFGTAYGQSGWFAGGGGGHSGNLGVTSIGGQGGGGRGGRHAGGNGVAALSGTPNTGGGGGSAWGGNAQEAIGDGGSGIVLIRYPIARVEE